MFLSGVALGVVIGGAMYMLLVSWQFKRLNNVQSYEMLASRVEEMLDDPRVPWEYHEDLDLARVALNWGVPHKGESHEEVH